MVNIKIASALVCMGCIGLTFASCAGGTVQKDNTLVVSIEPLRFIVEEIVGDDFEVIVLVPPGASPETYEPTPLQIRSVEDARLVFSTGLIGFETVILKRLPSSERFVNLSTGIELIAAGHDEEHSSHSSGGIDPHIWVAPKALARMAQTAYERIYELYPDSTSYTANYTLLAERLTSLDRQVSDRITASLSDASTPTRSFMIFHPGLTYYARDYGLRQIAIESDGKEPSARQLAKIVTLARAEGISKILYQKEFPRRVVEVAAAETGTEPVEIDILSYDIIGNILKITDLIT